MNEPVFKDPSSDSGIKPAKEGKAYVIKLSDNALQRITNSPNAAQSETKPEPETSPADISLQKAVAESKIDVLKAAGKAAAQFQGNDFLQLDKPLNMNIYGEKTWRQIFSSAFGESMSFTLSKGIPTVVPGLTNTDYQQIVDLLDSNQNKLSDGDPQETSEEKE